MPSLTSAAPRMRDNAGQFSKAGELTANLIRKAYSRRQANVGTNFLNRAPQAFGRRLLTATVIEFAERAGTGISLTTTKKVLRDLRSQNPTAQTIRPNHLRGVNASMYTNPSRAGLTHGDFPGSNQYRFKGQSLKGDPRGLPTNTVIVPRYSRHQKGNPTSVAMHEWGHAASHDLNYGIQKPLRKGKPGSAMASTSPTAKAIHRELLNERDANYRVLDAVKRHGSPEEVKAWKNTANRQMKIGYRNPRFKDQTEGDSLARKKNILRALPMLRSKYANLSRRLLDACVIEFATRPKEQKESGWRKAAKATALVGAGVGTGLLLRKKPQTITKEVVREVPKEVVRTVARVSPAQQEAIKLAVDRAKTKATRQERGRYAPDMQLMHKHGYEQGLKSGGPRKFQPEHLKRIKKAVNRAHEQSFTQGIKQGKQSMLPLVQEAQTNGYRQGRMIRERVQAAPAEGKPLNAIPNDQGLTSVGKALTVGITKPRKGSR